MELRQLRYLEAVARHRHFSRAADELHVAQSALSAQISKLERELGTKLFRRTTRSVELTEAGALAASRARVALGEAEALRREVDEVRGLVQGSLAIGALLPAGKIDFPALLQDFSARYPGIEIELREGTASEIIGHLRRGELDLAFALEDGEPPSDLERLHLSDDELVVAMSRRHELAGEEPIGIDALDGQPLNGFRSGAVVREALDRALAEAGAEPVVRLESSDLTMIRAMASRGFGLAVLPRSFAETPGYPVAIRPLDPRITLAVTLLWPRGQAQPPATRAFIDFARESAPGRDT